ncbi:MAG: amylo-alpha-1,6-glucosidase [Candidatus Aminicenantaceae bacterium]
MLKKKILLFCIFCFLIFLVFCHSSGRELPEKMILKKSNLHLYRNIQPSRYFESSGQQSAVLGTENGNAEVWIYPYKVLHDFSLHFILEEENRIIEGKNIASRIDVYPHQTVIRYVHSAFSVDEIFFTPLKQRGVIVLISVRAVKPVSVVASFVPDLKPMWPAGLGGQYSYWNDDKNYFVLSEGTGKNVALIGSPKGEQYSSGPAHALPEEVMKLKINIKDRSGQVLYPFIFSASHTGKKEAETIYNQLETNLEKLYEEKYNYYEKLTHDFLNIHTPDAGLNQAFQWAKVAVNKALVCNPQLGCGLVAGYGLSGKSERPGFAWFFGGDTFFNSWALNSYGDFKTSRQALSFLKERQRKDGKIMHELSQGAAFISWFEDYPYGFYHAETTPYYIVSMSDYLNWSGDRSFIEESWDSIKKAYEYVLSADKDGDGLMENTVAGLAALEFGAFLGQTKTDIYLASLSVQAHKILSKLALLMNNLSLSQKAQENYQAGLNSLREKFWIDEDDLMAHAINLNDEPLEEKTIWLFMPFFFTQLSEKRAKSIFEFFASSEMSTDWGVRSLSPLSEFYDPVNYNYGAVWPFLTGYTCLSEYRYRRMHAGYSHLKSMVHNTFIDALGFCPELLSGEFFTPVETAVPHQVFSSSPVVTCFVRGLLGLEADAIEKELRFSPQIPGSWDEMDIRNLRVGKDRINLSFQRKNGNKLLFFIESPPESPFKLHFSPFIGFGATVHSFKVNGKEKDFKLKNKGNGQCVSDLIIKGMTTIELKTRGSIFVDVPRTFPKLGDQTSRIKILRVRFKDNHLNIESEGLGGKHYSLDLMTNRIIKSVSGCEVKGKDKRHKKLILNFKGKEGTYFKKEVLIEFEKEV